MVAASGRSIRVYLLDDHDIVRQGIRDLLAPARDLHVVGSSGRASDAASAILAVRTDVMVLDLHLEDGHGALVCRQVRAADPSVRGLLLTSADDDEALAAALLAGASGVVVKLARTSHILEAVRTLGRGESMMDDDLARAAAQVLRARAERLTPSLSPEETEVLDHVLAGRTDPEVASALGSDPARVHAAVVVLVERLLSPVSR